MDFAFLNLTRNIEDFKEDYRLWYEFLKRNQNYQSFCEQWDQTKTIPDKASSLARVYDSWRDIHAVTFEEWWTAFSGQMTSMHAAHEELKEIIPQAVGPLGKAFPAHGLHILNSFRLNRRREPTPEELIQAVANYFEARGLYGTALFTIADLAAPSNEAKKAFQDAFSQAKTGLSSGTDLRGFPYFSTKLHRSELRRYLDAYDKAGKENGSGRKIYKVHGRYTYRDLEKANRIIANVEHNVFPGDYEKQ